MASMMPMTTQNRFGFSNTPTLKFMPMTPASTTDGSRITEASVRTRIVSFVRCAVRVMWTSNVPISISRAFATASAARARRFPTAASASSP